VSATLERLDWTNTTVLKGDVLQEVAQLKQRIDGEIVVNGSGRLVHALFEHDLVDEVRLMTFPFAVGAGERIFGETGRTLAMRLVDSRTVGDGLAPLPYRPVR